jgi:hypothetical protein
MQSVEVHATQRIRAEVQKLLQAHPVRYLLDHLVELHGINGVSR